MLIRYPCTVRVIEKSFVWESARSHIKSSHIKSHSGLRREIHLIEMVLSTYIFIKIICLVHVNMITRFDEIPAITLQPNDGNNEMQTDCIKDNLETVYPHKHTLWGV